MIGDVCDLGLFWAVALFKDQKNLGYLAGEVDVKPLVVDRVAAKMLAGIVAVQASTSHFVLASPLIVSRAKIDIAVAALDAALVLQDVLLELTSCLRKRRLLPDRLAIKQFPSP